MGPHLSCHYPDVALYIKYLPTPVLEASCLQIRPSCQGSSRLGWIYTEPNCVCVCGGGGGIKPKVSQEVIFEGLIVMGQIVQKRIVKNRVVLGQI